MNESPPPHFRRNFLLGVLNGTLVNFGLAFIDPFTVIPVFITRAGGSSLLVGLAAAVYGAGWFLPQVFVARYAQSRWRVLGIYRLMTVFRVLSWACVAAVVFLVDPAATRLFVWLVIVFMFAGTVGAGVAGVPFLEITSKTIPPERRGTFFGVRRLTGGLLGIFAGVVVAVVVGDEGSAAWASGRAWRAVSDLCDALGWTGRPFPYNYGILIVLGAVLSAAGMFLFGLIREPRADVRHDLQPLAEHVRAGFRLLAQRANYRLFLAVRIVWQLTSMAMPFYAVYAYSVLGFSEGSVGVFVSLWVGSGVVSNYAWGKLADLRGNRIVLVFTALIALLPPLTVLFVIGNGAEVETAANGWQFWLMCSTFVVNGCARSGRFISNMMYLLEDAPEDFRPLYVGFMNTLSFPFMLSPALGGALVLAVGFPTLFVTSAVFGLVSVVLSARLVEPRGRISDAQSDFMPV
jgi:MFS family permease